MNEKKKIVESIRNDCDNELSEVRFNKTMQFPKMTYTCKLSVKYILQYAYHLKRIIQCFKATNFYTFHLTFVN